MSLLLEALKKAEKAKEEAQRRAKGEPRSAGAAHRKRATGPREACAYARRAARHPAAPRDPQRRDRAAPARGRAAGIRASRRPADRATARKVFEAKFREPNPRLQFQIALASLGVAAIGIVAYFWYQLRPPAPLVHLNPQPATQQAAAPAPGPGTRPSAAATITAPAAIPGLPPVAAAAAAAPAPREAAPLAPERAVRVAPPVAPRSVPRSVPPPQPRLAEAPVTQTRQPPQIDPKVASGYAAYVAGDFATARSDYRAALRDDAGNRDALLGLAATDVRSGRLRGGGSHLPAPAAERSDRLERPGGSYRVCARAASIPSPRRAA